MKGELGEKIMKTFVGLRGKTYSNGNGNGNKIKKSNRNKKVCQKRKLKFKDYKNCLKATQLEYKTNQLEKNKVDK